MQITKRACKLIFYLCMGCILYILLKTEVTRFGGWFSVSQQLSARAAHRLSWGRVQAAPGEPEQPGCSRSDRRSPSASSRHRLGAQPSSHPSCPCVTPAPTSCLDRWHHLSWSVLGNPSPWRRG